MVHEIRGWRDPEAAGRRVVRRGVIVLLVLLVIGWVVLVYTGENLSRIGV